MHKYFTASTSLRAGCVKIYPRKNKIYIYTSGHDLGLLSAGLGVKQSDDGGHRKKSICHMRL